MKTGWVSLRAPQYNLTLKKRILLKEEGSSILMVLLLSGAVMRLGEVHTFYILWLYGSSVGGGLLTIDTDPFIKALAAFQSAEMKNQVVYICLIHVLSRAGGDTASFCIFHTEIHGEFIWNVYLPPLGNEWKNGIALLNDVAKCNDISHSGNESGQSAVCRKKPIQRKFPEVEVTICIDVWCFYVFFHFLI